MIRLLLLAAAFGLTIFYYFFFGAGPTASEMFGELAWWRPRGWALRWLPAKPLADMTRAGFPAAALPIGVLMAPAVALFLSGLALFRNAWIRALLLALALTCCIFVYYGYLAEGVWRFFDWRFSAVVLGFSTLVSGIVFAPSIFGAAWRAGSPFALALLLAIFALIFALSTEITGTSPTLAFNVSPWPILTLFGLLLVGYWIAALHAAAGLGVWLGKRAGGTSGLALGAICSFGAATALGLFVFSAPAARVTLGLSALLFAAALARFGASERGEAAGNARVRLAVGLFLFASILVSNAAASAWQSRARDETALQVLIALEKYKQDQHAYPDRIQDLLPAYLPEVPQPRIGLVRHAGDAFTYTGFGDSYALEFASVLWVQCQYSPPFEYAADDLEEGLDAEEAEPEDWEDDKPDVAAGSEPPSADDLAARATLAEHGLDGSWSCSETPPTLW